MRFLVLGSLAFGLITAVSRQVAADAPFEPFASTPDHVVSMTEAIGGGKERTRIVTHHGEWSRVENEQQDGRRSTQYFKRDEGTTVRIYGGPNEISSISVTRGPERLSLYDREPRKRGDQQTFLGESCTIWTMARTYDPGARHPPIERTSCVTDDGIELWYVIGGGGYMHGATATRLERRTVAAAEAQPPRDLLTLGWWKGDDQQQGASATSPDFETVMERAGQETQKFTRTFRQHEGWLSTEDIHGATRSAFTLEHAGRRLTLRYKADDKGEPKELILSSAPPLDPAQVLIPMTPQALDRYETILGHVCRWFNMTPGMMDAGLSSCRTYDGISLKDVHWRRGGRTTFTAVRFTRRPIALNEVLPPAELLAPKTWGLPD